MKKRLNPSQIIRLLCLLFSASSLLGNTSNRIDTEVYPPPQIICPDDTGQQFYTKNMQRMIGRLDETDRLIDLTNQSCFIALNTVSAGEHAYDTLTFSPSVTTRYNFLLAAEFASVFGLSYGGFNEDIPCLDGMGEATNSYNLPLSTTLNSPEQSLSFVLEAGESYTLFISNLNNNTLGDWELLVYNDGGGTLSGFDDPVPQVMGFDLLVADLRNIYFNSPQERFVDADGSLDTIATLALSFDNNQTRLNHFLLKLSYTGMPIISGDCGFVLTLTDEITTVAT